MLSDDVTDTEVVGGWKCLCAAVLLQAVRRKLFPVYYERRAKEDHAVFREACQWLEGGVGILSLEDCCNALNLDSEVLRDRLAQIEAKGEFDNVQAFKQCWNLRT